MPLYAFSWGCLGGLMNILAVSLKGTDQEPLPETAEVANKPRPIQQINYILMAQTSLALPHKIVKAKGSKYAYFNIEHKRDNHSNTKKLISFSL